MSASVRTRTAVGADANDEGPSSWINPPLMRLARTPLFCGRVSVLVLVICVG